MLRLKELDIIRGFATLNVVLFHYTTRFRATYGHDFPEKFDWMYGRYALESFFVLSGFVIFMTLHNVNNAREFAYKRFMRIVPTYWICLSITLIVIYFFQHPRTQDYTVYQVLMNFIVIQGLFEVDNIDGAYWSLVPEVLFYALMAGVYSLGFIKKVRTLGVIWLSLIVINKFGLLPFGAYMLNLEYGMFFLAGILFYEIKFNKTDFTYHLLIAACLFMAIWTHQTPGSNYMYLAIFVVFYLFIYNRLQFVNFSPFLFLGYISYPLYLLHQVIGFSLMRILKIYIPNDYAVILIAIVLICGLAWVVTKYLEQPALRFIKSKVSFDLFIFRKHRRNLKPAPENVVVK